MINALTIDVEDYWNTVQQDWLDIPDAKPTEAVLKNTRWLLQILKEYNVKATFFILGEVAQSFPELIKEIAATGHEIAVHGFYHHKIFNLSRDEFRNEAGDAKKLLENLSGQEVFGYRAPAFSIIPETKWALEVLAELGYKYDSSISPIIGKNYGWSGFKKEIHTMQLPNSQSIIEAPISTTSICGQDFAVGGGYIRHFPYIFTKWAIRKVQKGQPAIIYIHPHEIDRTGVPKLPVESLRPENRRQNIKHHYLQLRNRHTMKKKIKKLLSDFQFTTLKDVISENNFIDYSCRQKKALDL